MVPRLGAQGHSNMQKGWQEAESPAWSGAGLRVRLLPTPGVVLQRQELCEQTGTEAASWLAAAGGAGEFLVPEEEEEDGADADHDLA